VETVVEEETTVSRSFRCGLIIAVKRNGETEIATGSTVLKPGDKLICVVERK
jgi:Trk K+ transport system NAD-binding subunit